MDLTEQLDKEWRNIIPLIGSMVNKNKQKEAEEEEKAEEARSVLFGGKRNEESREREK